MTDTSQPGALSPIERVRLSSELMNLRASLVGGKLSPIERIQASARALSIRGQLGEVKRVASDESQAAEKKGSVSGFIGVGPHPEDAASGKHDIEPAPVAATVPAPQGKTHLVTGKLAQKNGGVLVMGDAQALAAYVSTYMDQAKFTIAPTGLLFTKSQARAAKTLPIEQDVLASGAVIYTYDDPTGVSVALGRDISGIARNLANLKSLMAQQWGPEKYRAVFGEDAAPADVEAFQEEQAAIAKRKQASVDAAANEMASKQLAQEQAQAKAKADAEETARNVAQQEAEAQGLFERTIAIGVAENPIYQAYLDTLEDLPTTPGIAGFLGWAGIRAGEYERKAGMPPSRDHDAYVAFVRQWADAHLSKRVKDKRAAGTASSIELTGDEFGDFPDTPEGKKALRAAVKAHLESMRGQMVNCPALGKPVEMRQRGIKETLAFSGNPKKLKLLHAVKQIIEGATTAEHSPNQKRDKKPSTVGYHYLKSAIALAGETIAVRVVIEQDDNGHLYYDLMIDPPKEKAMLDSTGSIPDDNSGRPFEAVTASANQRSPDNYSGRRLDSSLDHDDDGVTLDSVGHQVLNLFLGDELASAPAPVVEQPLEQPALQIIEYTTKREKVLRGVLRTDLTLAEAKAIDPYTWRMNGGYFIREKHLTGDTSAVQATPAPVVLSAEQQAEKQERDTRAALERQQQALANQVSKLREAGAKAVESGTAGMNAERQTNTHRRAGMAASAHARASNDESEGVTLNSIADAIELGAGGVLSGLTSRTQLQELKKALSAAVYESDKGLSYTEKQGRAVRQPTEQDLQHVHRPSRLVWATRFKNAALTIAKKAPTGNSKLIAALTKMGARAERWNLTNDGDIAITRKAFQVLGTVKEKWDLQDPMDMLARVDRLKRMGITNDAQMQDACRALLPHLAARKEESAITKAERAIIGQKVGIDFFPTPVAVAHRMAKLARIIKGTRVLEPSAGNGNLADAAAAAGGAVDVIEISSQLRDILQIKGYNVVDHDFNTFSTDEPYQAILMNPPFSKRQDAEHIMRAFGMLAAGGTLVAIAGEGVFFGQDQKAEQFRTWLDSHNADVEKLEGGTFQDNALLAQTSANARLIVLRK